MIGECGIRNTRIFFFADGGIALESLGNAIHYYTECVDDLNIGLYFLPPHILRHRVNLLRKACEHNACAACFGHLFCGHRHYVSISSFSTLLLNGKATEFLYFNGLERPCQNPAPPRVEIPMSCSDIDLS